ncbi:MAG: redox-regulated ATPase YchF [Anaerolineae bacterium]|nr:redox-regulated ATPase YchF [Anaerolineae bacterium]
MRLGVIGLPNSGKTTIFNALTGQNLETAAVSSGQFEVHTAVVNVPDARLDALIKMFNPKKFAYATITFADIAGLDKGMSEGGLKGQVRNELSQVDGFVHVVRAFKDETVPHPYVSIDPQRDLEMIEQEFLLNDMVTVEKRLQKIADDIRIKGKKLEAQYGEEQALFEAMKVHLDAEKPLRDFELTDEQEKSLRGYGFLTLKPVLIVLNLGDEAQDPATLVNYPHKRVKLVGLQGKLEAELSQFENPDDRTMFMEEYGITELSASKVIRLAYDLMAIQSFFTVGHDECRAWSVPIGATAPEAAGAIHSDLQKGFIRAEVMYFQDLLDAGSEAAVKQAGKFSLQGKDYIVRDGDIVHIRFNV